MEIIPSYWRGAKAFLLMRFRERDTRVPVTEVSRASTHRDPTGARFASSTNLRRASFSNECRPALFVNGGKA